MQNPQLSLFESTFPTLLSLKETARLLSVSEATVRNWISEGELTATHGHLSKKEVESFIKNHLGSKLKSRANKSQKDLHDHEALTLMVRNEVDGMGSSGETLAEKYEVSMSESFKNKEGIYYTPSDIVCDMMKDVDNVSDKLFLDPCCGSGNFLVAALQRGFLPQNIYGFDTDSNAVAIARKRLRELSGQDCEHVVCADFLASAREVKERFDYIYTNPPWGKKLPKQERDRYSQMLHTTSSDTCALFFEFCLLLLKNQGEMGLLLPESFFNIGGFEDARAQLLNYRIRRLVDYGKPFKGLLTKAKAFVMEKSPATLDEIACEVYGKRVIHRSQTDFLMMPKHIINFNLSESEHEVIRHVYSLPYVTLKNQATWALGIVTGNNGKICSTEMRQGCVPIYRGKDIFSDHVESPTLFISEHFDNCQQVAPLEFYKAKEKVIYRFINNRIICYYDTEQRYILNSANLFILKDDFPISYRQLVDLLNSDFMNWLFQSLFDTHKILRGDLEELPLWTEFFVHFPHFEETELLEYLEIEKDHGTYRIKG